MLTWIVQIVAANLGILPHAGPVDNRTPAQQVYETCKESFPNLRGESAKKKKRGRNQPALTNRHPQSSASRCTPATAAG